MDEFQISSKVIVTIILIASAIAIRFAVVYKLKKISLEDHESPRRWINTTNNVITLIIVVGLIIIWSSELQLVALSVATFAVALVIAGREFIQCLLGFFYQSTSRAFVAGDWVKIGNHYGEVVSNDWLSTKILEIDIDAKSYDYTGKTLVIPNNQLVTNTIHNLNFMRRYVSHSFSIIRDAKPVNAFNAKQYILERAQAYCEPFKDTAARYSHLIENRLDISLSGPEASVRIATTNLGRNEFTITVFCPTEQAVNIEQQLTEDFMNYWYAEIEKTKAKPTDSNTSGDEVD